MSRLGSFLVASLAISSIRCAGRRSLSPSQSQNVSAPSEKAIQNKKMEILALLDKRSSNSEELKQKLKEFADMYSKEYVLYRMKEIINMCAKGKNVDVITPTLLMGEYNIQPHIERKTGVYFLLDGTPVKKEYFPAEAYYKGLLEAEANSTEDLNNKEQLIMKAEALLQKFIEFNTTLGNKILKYPNHNL